MIWTEGNVRRIVLDMAAQIQKTSSGAFNGLANHPLDLNNDLGMDSLSRMTLAADVNEFFGLFHTSAENYLLTDSVLEHWVEKIRRARREKDDEVVFLTSGTSGRPRQVRHSMNLLLQEARVLQELLPRPAEVITTVPSHHIYGFLYTVILPELWQVPVRSLSEVNAATITADSLIIGTPFTWEYLYRTWAGSGAIACQGVCSSAPLSAPLFANLLEMGVGLFEIYGSTDTGGIGFRQSPGVPFHLFPHVGLVGGTSFLLAIQGKEELLLIPDLLEQVSENEIRVVRRLDGSVQIAGVNIVPAHVQELIANCPLVASCDLFAKAVQGQPQLFCSIHLRQRNEQTEQACLRWLKDNLHAPQIPRNIQFY